MISQIGSVGTGYRSALFSILADNISGRIRDDYFSSITRKDVSFFDVTKVGEISKIFVI